MSRPSILDDDHGPVALVVEPFLCVAGGILGGAFIATGVCLAAIRKMNRAARRPSTASGRKR